jgi:hypothetical protein
MTEHRDHRRKEAREADRAVDAIHRELEGRDPPRKVKLSEATAQDHLDATQGDTVVIIDDDEEE